MAFLMSEVPLVGTGRAAAVSLDFWCMWPPTRACIRSISFPAGLRVHPYPASDCRRLFHGLAEDGTLYVLSPSGDSASPDGSLSAYSPHSAVALAIAVPAVTRGRRPRTEPTMTSAPGQTARLRPSPARAAAPLTGP